MNKKYKLILFILFSTIFLISLSSAFFPSSHKYIVQQSLLATNASNSLVDACRKHQDLCFSANLLSDAFVTDYWSNFKRYAVTHTPSFCTAIIKAANGEDELACAVGACTHQPADLTSHEKMIEYAISHTFLPNILVHPPAEQKLDVWVARNNPEIDFDKVTSLNSYKTCKPLFIRVLAANNEFRGVDIDGRIDKFVQEIQKGGETRYDPSFRNVSSLPNSILILFFSLLTFFLVPAVLIFAKKIRFKDRRTIGNWITFIIFLAGSIIMLYIFIMNFGGQGWTAVTQTILKPLSLVIPIGGDRSYIDAAVQNTKNFFINGESALYNSDASGELKLMEADSKIHTQEWIIIGIVLALILYVLYRNLRETRPKGGGIISL